MEFQGFNQLRLAPYNNTKISGSYKSVKPPFTKFLQKGNFEI